MKFHAFNHAQVNLISRLMFTGRAYRMWPTRNGGLALMWQSRSGQTLAATPSGMHSMNVYKANAPVDNWTHGSGAHGIERAYSLSAVG
jgi:hypothetical protein